MKSSNSAANPHISKLKRLLTISVSSWVGLVLIGQFIFALYILFQFTMPLITGQIDESRYTHMIRGYVNGDVVNNAILLAHVIPVMVISLSGTLQLVPSIRTQFPGFHRINGRLFLLVGLFGAISGLYLTWITGSRLSDLGALGVTVNGLLIPVMTVLAWKYAVEKRFQLHRKMAVHSFILINGVFTFRLYLMGWFMLHQGRAGNSPNIDGPADIALSFASYLLPMLVAEVVFWSEKQKSAKTLTLAITGVCFAALITAIGVIAATMMMWGPRIIAG